MHYAWNSHPSLTANVEQLMLGKALALAKINELSLAACMAAVIHENYTKSLCYMIRNNTIMNMMFAYCVAKIRISM